MREGTVILVVRSTAQGPRFVEALSDDQEISVFEKALAEGDHQPLLTVAQLRQRMHDEDEEFGDYVEELLSQPFLKPDVQEQAVQWLKSKLRIEEFRKAEREATLVIADYAYQIYQDDPKQVDFFLAGAKSRVRVKVLEVNEDMGDPQDEGHNPYQGRGGPKGGGLGWAA